MLACLTLCCRTPNSQQKIKSEYRVAVRSKQQIRKSQRHKFENHHCWWRHCWDELFEEVFVRIEKQLTAKVSANVDIAAKAPSNRHRNARIRALQNTGRHGMRARQYSFIQIWHIHPRILPELNRRCGPTHMAYDDASFIQLRRAMY